jgi:molybdenum cofactor cytidylyltransferase
MVRSTRKPAGDPTPPVDGIVLAAGLSSRMGQPKADLVLDGRSFLDHCIALLRQGGCRSVAVVAGARAAARATGLDDVVYTLNPDPASPQIASIAIGLAALPADSAAAAVLPVDAPAVRPETVRRLIAAFRGAAPGTALIVRPVYRGRAGHPTLFAHPLFPELSGARLPRGAESVVERHAGARLDVEVDDPAIALNVNSPEDYRRLLEGS